MRASGYVPTTNKGTCHRCSTPFPSGDVYCANCGAKLVGRDYGLSRASNPAGATTCINCGNQLRSGSMFCKYCGTKVERNV
ncbi:MAG: double zinc ribbon domain-containing protein [Candidatus Hodarchaeales archaeon]